MQNKPNLNWRETKICKTNPILPQFFHSFLQLFTRQLRTFAKKSQKMSAFCKYLKTTHLTPYTTKTYKNIYPSTRFTAHQSRPTKKCKTNPISITKMSKRSGCRRSAEGGPMADKTNPISTGQNVEAKRRSASGGQNEPNYNLLIHSSTQEFIRQGRTHLLFHAKQTQFNQQRLFTHLAPRFTDHEPRFMQNKPNFKASRIVHRELCKTNPIPKTYVLESSAEGGSTK